MQPDYQRNTIRVLRGQLNSGVQSLLYVGVAAALPVARALRKRVPRH
jgi:hypothetical protein